VDDTRAQIPDREWFKTAEVCEIAGVQPYVLRSWEIEFPNLGIQRSTGGSRAYRRSDVERVLKIRQLVFGEGLTLAGARRRIEGDPPAAEAEEPAFVDTETRTRLAAIRQELQSLHEWLSEERRPAPSGPIEAQPALPDLGTGASTRTDETWPPKGRTRRQGGKKK
jgi:DNA-binding transcriptional MerR regulator